MSRPAKPDIISLIKHVCLAVQSFAESRQVEIIFVPGKRVVRFHHNPCNIIHSLSQMLCSIIQYVPPLNKITITTSIVNNDKTKLFQVSLCSTGINFCEMKEITNQLKFAVTVNTNSNEETNFIMQVTIPATQQKAATNLLPADDDKNFPVFFEEVRKRLQKHFSRTNNPLENLKVTDPRKAAFLQKINNCILQNLHNENFDATALSKSMAMSRTQLFRKLKPIISQSPASYIRSIRLQKAKDLLQSTDKSVSEVAYKTGFKTPSHFTKLFTQKFGIRPSAFSQSTQVTNQ